MPKVIKVLVSTVDTDLEFTIQSSTTGKLLFDKVIRSLGVREAWYFGLLYATSSNQTAWLDLAKKISSQTLKKQDPLRLKFLAKYFPEDAAEELILPLTKHLFFLQVLNSVLTDEYYTPPETSVLLASFALQAKYGVYDPSTHNQTFFEKEKIIPDRVIKQHSLTKAEWDEKVITWYKEHKEMEKETAMVEYLKVAQDLDMYGISYFDITNKKGSPLWLGVDALGINVYDKSDKLTPKIGFPWSEVSKVSYSGKKFVVKPSDPNAPNFIFLASKSDINKKIIGLARGNYEMYSRRRKPDSIELQQMKAQVKEDEEIRERQRLLLLKEKEHRSLVESQNKELETQLEEYKRRVESSNEDLERTQRTSEELRVKLEELQVKKQELEESERQAYEAKKVAEEAVNAVLAEKLEKEQQARDAQEMLEKKEAEAREKEEEARLLQEELQRTRQSFQQYESLPRYDATEPISCVDTREFIAQDSVEPISCVDTREFIAQDSMEPISCVDTREFIAQNTIESPFYSKQEFHNNGGAGGSSRGSSVGAAEGALYAKELRQLDQAISEQTFVDGKSVEQESHDFQHSFLNVEEDKERLTEAEMNIKLGNQLKSLRQELEEMRSEGEMTKNDQIYVKNVKQGRDKYKTLKQIRQGNTKIRIETFESL